MPSLVTELTPLQRMWLYENQLTRGDSYEEKWAMQSSSFDSTVFRSRPEPLPRKRKVDEEEQGRHRSHNKGPRFPHHGDKLTWQQSLENLRVYRDHYGVSDLLPDTSMCWSRLLILPMLPVCRIATCRKSTRKTPNWAAGSTSSAKRKRTRPSTGR